MSVEMCTAKFTQEHEHKSMSMFVPVPVSMPVSVFKFMYMFVCSYSRSGLAFSMLISKDRFQDREVDTDTGTDRY